MPGDRWASRIQPSIPGIDVAVAADAAGATKPASPAESTSPASIRLTPTEWHLLEVLLRHPGKLMSQRQLLAEVWGPGYADATGNLRLYMTQLRRKLEPDPARPRWLLTEPGMGYRYQPDEDEQTEEDVSLPRQRRLAHRRKSRGPETAPGGRPGTPAAER